MVDSTTPLLNANDSTTGRDGGPYLDVHQAQQSEVNRAAIEGREPDLDNPPANAGIQLNRPGQQMTTENVNNIPSQDNRTGTGFTSAAAIKAAVDSDENLLKVASEVDDAALTEDREPAVEQPVSDDYTANGSTEVGPKEDGTNNSDESPLPQDHTDEPLS